MPEAAAVVETHVSTLFFAGDLAIKFKKPVKTAFLDFTTREARYDACVREVELNRRIAPDVYLGVADLVLEGSPIDHVVLMRRMPSDRRLSNLLHSPSVEDELRHIARTVAAFHARATHGPDIDRCATRDANQALWTEGITQLSAAMGSVLTEADVDRLRGLVDTYLAGRAPLFDARIGAGHAVDGHGDLLADDIFCLRDGPRILDCLEFDDELRYADVLADVAFLAMDLDRLGHRELGERFLRHYREMTADHWPSSLAHFYIAYRAHVRAKVACLRHAQGDGDAADTARSLHRLAIEHLEAGRVQLILVGGKPGTGKSTLARELASRIDAVLLSSDELRKDLAGIARTDHGDGVPHEGRYTAANVRAVYAELLQRAEALLSLGECVIIDASWLSDDRRRDARDVAEHTSSSLIELCCVCPAELAAERIVQRRRVGHDPSDATVEVARRLSEEADPWPLANEVATDGSIEHAVSAAEAIVTGSG